MALNLDCIASILELLDNASLRRMRLVSRAWSVLARTIRRKRANCTLRRLVRRMKMVRETNLGRSWVIQRHGRSHFVELFPCRTTRSDSGDEIFEVPRQGDFLTGVRLNGIGITRVVIKVNGLDYHKTFHANRETVSVNVDVWLPMKLVYWCRISVTVTCLFLFSAQAHLIVGEAPMTDPASAYIVNKFVWLGKDMLAERVLISGGFMTMA